MRKYRGFRLGRKLVRVWGCIFRRRPKQKAYLCLSSTPPSPTRTSHSHHHKGRPTVATIFDWCCRLIRRLCPSPRLGGGRGYYRLPGGDRDNHHQKLLPLEEEQASKPPKGHLAVYVGSNDEDPPHRFLVPVIYFNHPLFAELLKEAEQEYGFEHPGGITIPCPISDFKSVQTRIAAAGAHCHRSARMRLRS